MGTQMNDRFVHMVYRNKHLDTEGHDFIGSAESN